jgi:hypothetical protein
MDHLFTEEIIEVNTLFDNKFLDPKVLFLYCFKTLPNIDYFSRVDGEKLFFAFRTEFRKFIMHIHQYRHEGMRNGFGFDTSIVRLTKNCLVAFEEDQCKILHDGTDELFVEEIAALVRRFKEKERKKPLEINLIVQSAGCMELRAMEIKPTKLDVELFYEDDFKEVDMTIRKRLNRMDDKGIILLHGLPGTGKTTYLRYLVGKIRKRVLFLSPSVAGNLMNPDFIELLIDHPNSVVIIEDAENIIMDRRHTGNSAVSNLLNISDGLLADFLNVQLVCTFNNSLTMVDQALMRKGRMIAKYEFGKLGISKARRLSAYFGHDTVINEPMTIADIANPHEKGYNTGSVEVVGFKRKSILSS